MILNGYNLIRQNCQANNYKVYLEKLSPWMAEPLRQPPKLRGRKDYYCFNYTTGTTYQPPTPGAIECSNNQLRSLHQTVATIFGDSWPRISEKQIKAFLEKVKGDPNLEEKLRAAADADAMVIIARDVGFMISADEVKNTHSDLSEEELEGIAGGYTYPSLQTKCVSCKDICG